MDESLIAQIKRAFSIEKANSLQLSPLALAYIGDAVFELVVRSVAVSTMNVSANELHKYTSSIVKASAQAEFVRKIKPLLTEDEKNILKRGRNAKSHSTAKNSTVNEYRKATGLEALMGYLYLEGQMDRLIELIHEGMKGSTDA